MQLNPIKPTLKASGIKLFKMKYDKPLSNFAFKFNLCRYNKATRSGGSSPVAKKLVADSKARAYTRPLLSST